MKITYLGPAGSTFTAIAYDKLAALYGAPLSTDSGIELALAKANEEVVPLVLAHGGFAALAMETRAEGRVDQPINSFIELLRGFDRDCPIQVIGALCMRVRFAFMVQKGISMNKIKTVITHPKGLGACRENLRRLNVKTIESSSNGKAAEDVSRSRPEDMIAALGPIQAAEKYGLDVLIDSFEDREAITTFFLLGPRSHQTKYKAGLNSTQRSLNVFRIQHEPGALVKVLTPFAEEGVNLRLIHSLYWENGVYDFAIETENTLDSSDSYVRAIGRAERYMSRWIQFGPFPVISE